MRLDVRHNFPDVVKRAKALADDVRDKVMTRTINKVTTSARGQMAKAISGEYRMKQSEVRENLRVTRAQMKAGRLYLEATLYSPSTPGRRGFNLIRFVVGRVPKGGKGRPQLGLQIRRSGGRKYVRGAFVATNKKTGGTAVFIRSGSTRKPIETVTTIHIPQMFNARVVNQQVIDYINERLPVVFAQEFNFATRVA